MTNEQLQELGLSENEAAVYHALLQLGPSTVGPITKKAHLYRVIVYDTLEKLMRRGLVTYSLKRNWKYFTAENPRRLVEMMQEKQKTAAKLAKELEQIQADVEIAQGAFIYEGWNGIRTAQEQYFSEMKSNAGGEYLMVGASKSLHKRLDAFFNEFHRKRAKIGVPAKLLFNENNRRAGKLKAKYQPATVRFMPKKVVTPSWISTYKDMVLIGVAEGAPMAFLIKNTAVAESYRHYFYFMWGQSKKV
ncbi:MAG: hypothetical protein OXR66_09745 [Candidatus Woesearchaeota archaeon]|nr:hypothetical protein [Candidatus Woesearchaeota archaeon]